MQAIIPPQVTLATINREAYILFGAGAAVAWQMALPGVGRGVAAHSQTLQRPLARLRATLAFLYAVSIGDKTDRDAIAAHINRAHRGVKGNGYNAFDPELQLWVAATLYQGALQMYELFVGQVPVASRQSLYRQAWAFGRTLQVRDEQWPPTVGAFDQWWQQQQAVLSVEPAPRQYLQALLDGRHASWWLRPALPLQSFATRALLPEQLRHAYGLAWDSRDEQRWQRFKRWAPRLYWKIPAFIRHCPARYYLKQLRRQSAASKHPD